VNFHWCFEYDGWWSTLPIFFLIPWVNWWFNIITINSSWWYDHCWIHLIWHLPLRNLLTGSPFSPFEGWFFFTIIINHFSHVLCAIMLIMSRTTLPSIFKFISFCFIRFWELWLFNYLLTLTLYFPTLNLMHWHYKD
jgi:hypothetical protein